MVCCCLCEDVACLLVACFFVQPSSSSPSSSSLDKQLLSLSTGSSAPGTTSLKRDQMVASPKKEEHRYTNSSGGYDKFMRGPWSAFWCSSAKTLMLPNRIRRARAHVSSSPFGTTRFFLQPKETLGRGGRSSLHSADSEVVVPLRTIVRRVNRWFVMGYHTTNLGDCAFFPSLGFAVLGASFPINTSPGSGIHASTVASTLTGPINTLWRRDTCFLNQMRCRPLSPSSAMAIPWKYPSCF